MVEQLILSGVVGGGVSAVALVMAGFETVKLHGQNTMSGIDRALHSVYSDAVDEEVPLDMTLLLSSLGGDSNANNSEDSAGS